MYSFVYSFVYLYMYSVEWSRRRRGSGWILRLKTIYIASITCVSASPRSCLPLLFPLPPPLTSFYIYCYWIHCVIGSPVCVNWYIRFHHTRLRFFFFFFLLTRSAARRFTEEKTLSETNRRNWPSARKRDRAVSRFSDRGQGAQQFWVCLGN